MLEIYLSKRYSDSRLLELAKIVEVKGEKERSLMSAEVEVFTKDGKLFKSDRVSFRNPSRKDIAEKFVHYASTVLPEEKVTKIVEHVNRLEHMDNIRELMQNLATD